MATKKKVERADAAPRIARRFVPPADTPGAVVTTVTLSRRSHPVPVIVAVDDKTMERLKNRVSRERVRVLRDELLVRDPGYATSLSRTIRSIIDSVARLEHLTTGRESHVEIVRLGQALRLAVDVYLAPLNGEQ